jgi:beta-phosphoglucomutase
MLKADRFPISGFIFDLDGVLTDTSEFHYQAWQRFCDELGIPFDRARCEHLRGVHRAAAMRGLLEGLDVSPQQFEELLDRKNRYFLEYLHTVSPANVLPGARELLEAIRSASLKIAVASASKNAPQVVERLQIVSLLDTLSDGNCVSRSKPAPDLFLHAAGQLGLPPAACVVVEDAEAGVAAAHAAGMRVIGLGPPARVGRADLVLADLSQARLEAIMSHLLPVRPPPGTSVD